MSTNEGTYRTNHDVTQNGLSVTVAQAVAEVEDVDAADLLDDFSKYADPDALDRLFRVRPGDEPRHEAGRIHLEIRENDVTIHADGEIVVDP